MSLRLPGAQAGIVINVVVDGNIVTGDVSQAKTAPLTLSEGTISGERITFSIHVPNGNRTVTLAGTLKDDEIAFLRTAKVHEGGAPGGQGFFGVTGAPSFLARRAPK